MGLCKQLQIVSTPFGGIGELHSTRENAGYRTVLPEHPFHSYLLTTKPKLRGMSPRANYTDRATAACRRSWYQLLRIEGATWSA
jgi:hypothetical protein